jgi:hypothetical protein
MIIHWNKKKERRQQAFLIPGQDQLSPYFFKTIPTSAPKGVTLKLFSPSEELIAILSDTDRSGRSLNVTLSEQKMHGVTEFSFNIAKDLDIPITRNTECYFYVNQVLWKIGYIRNEPQPDQDSPLLLVEGNGFASRLEKKVINESYTSQTLDYIVKDIASTYLGEDIGVYYAVAKIDTPSVSGITLEFKDKDLLKVFDQLIQIANYNYDTDKYRWYVDNEKELVFENLSETVITNLFEGYQYLTPEVSIDNTRIVNKILAYRTTSADPDVVEFVNTYQDTASQSRYGLFEKKLTFADYIDTATVQKICEAILARNGAPSPIVKVINFPLGDNPLSYGKYRLSNKKDRFWNIAADCDTLTGWDTAGISATTLSLSTTHVLTGRQSLKFVTASGSNGEYVEFTLPVQIPFPLIARVFVYFDSTAIPIQVTFYDDLGNEVDIDFSATITNQWARFTQDVQLLTEVVSLYVDPNGTEENLYVDPNGSELDLVVRNLLQDGLFNVQKVRITILTDTAATFYVDRLDAYATVYAAHELQLEEVEYNLSRTALVANINFGEMDDSVVDEIKKKVKPGDLALDVFSKQ